MIMINKKGVAQETGDILIAIFALALAFVIVLILSNNVKNEKIETSKFLNYDAILQNQIGLYLKQPVEVNGKEMQMAEYISYIVEDDSYYSQLKNQVDWARATGSSFYGTPFTLHFSVYEGSSEKYNCKIDPPAPSTFLGGVWDSTKRNILFGLSDILKKDDFKRTTIYLPSYSGKTIALVIDKQIVQYWDPL